MLRSLYSGISGMRVNQTKLDVIGNNIANVGTTGFKVSRTRFQDMLSQNVTQALGPGLNQGGVNGSSVGLGVKLAGIDTVVKQGNMQPTSRNLDVAVDGEGYFMVMKGTLKFGGEITVNKNETEVTLADTAGSQISYTRDGSFTTDSDGNLLTSDGLRVLGYEIADNIDDAGVLTFRDANDPDNPLVADEPLGTLKVPEKVMTDEGEKRIISFSIEKDGLIKAVLEDGKVTALGQIAMASFRNPAGLQKMGSNLLTGTANSGVAIIRTGIGADPDNGKGYGDMLQGVLEMSNVDLAEQFTDMIVATRAFQASGKMISNGDEVLQDIINLKR